LPHYLNVSEFFVPVMCHQHLWENLQRTYHLHGRTIIWYIIIFDIKTIKMKDTPINVQILKTQKNNCTYRRKTGTLERCHVTHVSVDCRCAVCCDDFPWQVTNPDVADWHVAHVAHVSQHVLHWTWLTWYGGFGLGLRWIPLDSLSDWTLSHLCALNPHPTFLRTDMVPLVVSRMSRMCGGRMAQKVELQTSKMLNILTTHQTGSVWLSELVTCSTLISDLLPPNSAPRTLYSQNNFAFTWESTHAYCNFFCNICAPPF